MPFTCFRVWPHQWWTKYAASLLKSRSKYGSFWSNTSLYKWKKLSHITWDKSSRRTINSSPSKIYSSNVISFNDDQFALVVDDDDEISTTSKIKVLVVIQKWQESWKKITKILCNISLSNNLLVRVPCIHTKQISLFLFFFSYVRLMHILTFKILPLTPLYTRINSHTETHSHTSTHTHTEHFQQSLWTHKIFSIQLRAVFG